MQKLRAEAARDIGREDRITGRFRNERDLFEEIKRRSGGGAFQAGEGTAYTRLYTAEIHFAAP